MWIHKREVTMFLLVGFFLLRIPSLFEPYWHGGEGIYLSIGQSLRSGTDLYSEIYSAESPFLYSIATLVNGSQFWFRLISLLWGGLTIVAGLELFRKLFDTKPQLATYCAWILALVIGLPIWRANIASAEYYLLLPMALAFRLLLNVKSRWIAWEAGVLFGLAGLFKVSALANLLVWPLVWTMFEKGKHTKDIVWLLLGAMLPVGLLTVGSMLSGNTIWLPIFLNFSFRGGFGELTPDFWSRILVFALLLLLTILWRKSMNKETVMAGLWLIVTGFMSFASGKPYPQYFLLMVLPFCLALGVFVGAKIEGKRLLACTGFVVGFFCVSLGLKPYPAGSYYRNFLLWLFGKKTMPEYFQTFDPSTNDNYEIASIVTAGSSPSDRLFIWGDQPTIYALARRAPATKYLTKSHILDLRGGSITLTDLEESPPRYVVSFGDEDQLPGLFGFLSTRYSLEKRVGNAQIFRLSKLALWLR